MAKLSPLASPTATREVLEAHGLSTKYKLGQNFLINDVILQKIIALAEVAEDDYVLEIGPGIGTLTIALLKHAGHVVSVECDTDLPAVLADTLFPWADKFALIGKDGLALTEADLQGAAQKLGLAPGALPNKLVANLPYAVAATLVLDYFENFSFLESATVMVQKEVADRMSAVRGTKNYGAYTVKLSLFAQPVDRFAVGPGNFFPPPRVESTVLRLERRTLLDEAGQPVDVATIKAACTMADAAFASRRKTLANSCKTYFARQGAEGAAIIADLPKLFEQADIDPRLRGEALTTQDYIRMGAALLELPS